MTSMDRVGRYLLLRTLPDDGGAQVHVAHDPELDREVRVVLLPADAAGERLERARALAQLAHPALVAVHDAGEVGDQVFIVRERASGRILEAWVRDTTPGWRALRDALVEAGRGLAAAHRAGLVHGTIGARSIVVGENGRARLSGLSVAPPPGASPTRDVRHFADLVAPLLTGAPRWFSRAIEQARSGDGATTMDELAAALDREPARRRSILAIAGIGAVFAALATYRGVQQQLDARCTSAGARVVGVWDARRRAELEQSFGRSGLPFAADAADGVVAALDSYVSSWTDMHGSACQATRTGEQTDAALDLRMRCLEERIVQVDALVGVLTAGDETVIRRAVQAAGELPSLSTCADVARLADVTAPPTELQPRVTEIRRQVADASALRGAGKYEDGRVEAGEAWKAAVELAFQPLVAEAGLVLAQLQVRSGHEADAEGTYLGSIQAAWRGHHMRAAATAWHGLSFLLGDKLGRLEEGAEALEMAKATVERLGDSRLVADVRHGAGVLAYRRGRYEEALRSYEVALHMREAELGAGHLSLAGTHNNIGNTLIALERNTEALEHYEKARAIWRDKLGGHHPRVGVIENNMGTVYFQRREWKKATASFERALKIREAALGPDHPDVAGTLNNLGSVYQEQGQHREALPYHERALEIRRKAYGPEHSETATSLVNLGSVYRALRRLDDAATAFEAARVGFTASLGEEHPLLATVMLAEGFVEHDRGKPGRALELHRAAFERARKAYGGDQPAMIQFMQELATTLAANDQRAEAIELLGRARALAGGDRPVAERASLAFQLARVRWEARDGRPGALALARQARELLGDTEDPEMAAEIDAWLAVRKK